MYTSSKYDPSKFIPVVSMIQVYSYLNKVWFKCINTYNW